MPLITVLDAVKYFKVPAKTLKTECTVYAFQSLYSVRGTGELVDMDTARQVAVDRMGEDVFDDMIKKRKEAETLKIENRMANNHMYSNSSKEYDKYPWWEKEVVPRERFERLRGSKKNEVAGYGVYLVGRRDVKR